MALDAVFRDHWSRVLAILVGILGDIELAEEAPPRRSPSPPNARAGTTGGPHGRHRRHAGGCRDVFAQRGASPAQRHRDRLRRGAEALGRFRGAASPRQAPAAPLAARLLPESHGAPKRLDLPGVTLVTAGVTAIVWALACANDAGWSSPQILAALLAGTALLAGFLARENRAAEPLVPLRLFRARAASTSKATQPATGLS